MATVEVVEKVKVAAYCRVSTESDAQSNSFEAQKAFFQDYCNQENRELYKIYADEGISGTKLKQRKEFEKMLNDAGLKIVELSVTFKNNTKYSKYVTMPDEIRKPNFKYIFVKSISRFSRNIDAASILKDLAAVGVFVKFLDYGWCYENAGDIGQIQMFLNFAELESRDKSRNTKWGFDRAIESGKKIHTSGKLYGYRYIQDENRLEIIPEEAAVIKQIFELHAQGEGARRITNILTEQGSLTRQGESFCKSSIMRIITNEKYTGVSNRGKYDTGLLFINKRSYPKVKDEYKLTETDKIPAIIEQELFDKCRDRINSKTNHIVKKGIYSGLSEFSGFLYCETCGRAYYSNYYLDKRQKTPKVYDYYMCSKRKLEGKKACNNPNIETQDIINYIRDLMENRLADIIRYDWERTIEQLTNLQYFLMGRTLSKDAEQIKVLNAEISELSANKNRWFDLYGSGNIKAEDIEARILPIDKQIQQKQTVIDELSKTPKEFVALVDRTKANIEAIRNIKIVKHEWIPSMESDGVFAAYDDSITKDFYDMEDIRKYIDRIIVHADGSLSLGTKGTTASYNEYIETFGYDLDSLESLSEDDRISLEQKYTEILEIYQ